VIDGQSIALVLALAWQSDDLQTDSPALAFRCERPLSVDEIARLTRMVEHWDWTLVESDLLKRHDVLLILLPKRPAKDKRRNDLTKRLTAVFPSLKPLAVSETADRIRVSTREYFVYFRPGIAETEARAMLTAGGYEIVRTVRSGPEVQLIVRSKEETLPAREIDALRTVDGVDTVEENTIYIRKSER